MIKLIAVDMDGTFLNDQKTYNKSRFEQLLKQMQQQNIHFVVASGNQYFQLRSFFPDNYQDIAFVSENGANIVLGETAFYNAELDNSTLPAILESIEQTEPSALIICGKNSAYIADSISDQGFEYASFYYPQIKKLSNLQMVTEENDALFKFALSYSPDNMPVALEALKEKLVPRLIPVTSGHEDIDLIIPGVHKFSGLQRLGELWQIKPEEMMAFGDSGNDLEMLENVKYSYAMANASKAVHAAANYSIGSNNTEELLDTIQQVCQGTFVY